MDFCFSYYFHSFVLSKTRHSSVSFTMLGRFIVVSSLPFSVHSIFISVIRMKYSYHFVFAHFFFIQLHLILCHFNLPTHLFLLQLKFANKKAMNISYVAINENPLVNCGKPEDLVLIVNHFVISNLHHDMMKVRNSYLFHQFSSIQVFLLILFIMVMVKNQKSVVLL